jgi:hypothetical protein
MNPAEKPETQQDEKVQNEDSGDKALPKHPVIMEDAPIHDGVHPCGDPTCFCATIGYPA